MRAVMRDWRAADSVVVAARVTDRPDLAESADCAPVAIVRGTIFPVVRGTTVARSTTPDARVATARSRVVDVVRETGVLARVVVDACFWRPDTTADVDARRPAARATSPISSACAP